MRRRRLPLLPQDVGDRRPSRPRRQRDLGSFAVGGLVGAAAAAAGAFVAKKDARGRTFVLPPYHEPGKEVPRGGASCANCKWVRVREDGSGEVHCAEPGFILWNGGTRVPVDDARDYVSDWWEPMRGAYQGKKVY